MLQQKADTELVSRLDNNRYNENDLLTITVPLSMPYLTDSKDFERKDGEITLNGKIYHYVKQRIFQGNLILMCLPDEQKMHLENAKDNFFRLANELQTNASSKRSGGNNQVIKFSVSDYIQTEQPDLFSYSYYNNTYWNDYYFFLPKPEITLPKQPPEETLLHLS